MALPQSPAFVFWHHSDQMDENWKAMELEWFSWFWSQLNHTHITIPHFENFTGGLLVAANILHIGTRWFYVVGRYQLLYISSWNLDLGKFDEFGEIFWLFDSIWSDLFGKFLLHWFVWGPFLGEHVERFSEQGWINEIWSLHSLPWESKWWMGHQRAMLPTRLYFYCAIYYILDIDVHSRKHILQEKGSTVCSGNLFVIARNALLEIFVRVKRPLDVKHKPVSNCGFGSAQFGNRMRSNNCTASNKG